jgi:hypothetical protein
VRLLYRVCSRFAVSFYGHVYGATLAESECIGELDGDGGYWLSEPGRGAMYATTKHAVKGFTDALRVEIQGMDKAPVSITLIQPTVGVRRC